MTHTNSLMKCLSVAYGVSLGVLCSSFFKSAWASEIVVDADADIAATDSETVLRVESGTARLLPRAEYGYKHYRFKVFRPYGVSARSVQFSEVKLMDGVEDVTSRMSGFEADCGAYDIANRFPWNSTYISPTGREGYPEYYNYLFDGNLSTRVTDWYGAMSASATNRDKVWVKVDFASEQRVTSYDWARSNYWYNDTRSDSPDPADWCLQGSEDGETWVDLDVRRDFLTPYTPNRVAAWVGPFSCLYPQDNRVIGRIGMGDSGRTVGVKDCLYVDEVSGGSLDLVEGATLKLRNGSRVSKTIIQNGCIEKIDEGQANIEGNTSFAGTLLVSDGELRMTSGRGNVDQYYRFKFRRTSGRNQILLGRILLYDVEGNRVGGGAYSLVRDVLAKDLNPGQIACSSAYTFNQYETPTSLFHDDLTSDRKCFLNKIGGVTANLDGSNGMSLEFVVRLRSGSAPVCRYLFESADGSNRWCAPDSWSIESSMDGETWRMLDDVASYTASTPNANWTLWNGGVTWTLSNLNDPADEAFLPTATVAIASGARLNLEGSERTKIGSLAIDLLAGAGSIDVLNLATVGEVRLSGVSAWKDALVLPLSADVVTGVANLSNWSVYVDDKVMPWRLTYENGSICARKKGLLVIFQ